MKVQDLLEDEAIINMMVGQMRNLKVKPEKVEVKHKPHKRSVMKQCYNNSWRYIQDHYKEDAKYILGYVVYKGLPMDHAWVKVGDTHYDVTLNPGEDYEHYAAYEVPQELLDEYVNSESHAPDLFALDRFLGRRKK